MIQKHLQFSFAFLLIFIFQIFLDTDTTVAKFVFSGFHYAIKPLITISLMIWLSYHTQLKGRFSKRIFIGLIFGLLGDSLLMFQHLNEFFFMFGLISFTLGHIAYSTAFYIDYNWAPKIEKKSTNLGIIFFGIFAIAFYLLLRPHLGKFNIPVLIYAIVIAIMVIMANSRRGKVKFISFNLIFYGAILFMISDAILGYQKFVSTFLFSNSLIMITYMPAQYLITIGAIERKLKKHSIMDNQA
jgi:uncharacterized membrane protein YhhN